MIPLRFCFFASAPKTPNRDSRQGQETQRANRRRNKRSRASRQTKKKGKAKGPIEAAQTSPSNRKSGGAANSEACLCALYSKIITSNNEMPRLIPVTLKVFDPGLKLLAYIDRFKIFHSASKCFSAVWSVSNRCKMFQGRFGLFQAALKFAKSL